MSPTSDPPGDGTDDVHVTAVVVAWNSADHLPACLDSLDTQDHPSFEVVVVDNASRDATPQQLAAASSDPDRRHRLRVVTNANNRGFAGGVNDALATLDERTDAVLLVNPDVVAPPDLVHRLVRALAADRRRGSVQPKLHRVVPDGEGRPVIDTTGHVLTSARLLRNRGEGETDHGQYDDSGEVFGASGALVLHRRAMLDDVAWRLPDGRVEVLNEDLFAYFDDVELDWRARLLGWDAWYESTAVATHQRGGAGPRRSDRVEALNWSNRLLVLAICDDRRSLLRALPVVVVTTLLKTVEFAVTHPRAVPEAWRRLGLRRRCRWRRRQLMARSVVSSAHVVARYVEPFSWRRWVTTWWRRVTGRAPGVG